MPSHGGSTLQQAVSQLIQASMGSSISETIPNDELDRHVTELILQEARHKEERYEELGLGAYLPAEFPESTAPKTNKRFLSSVLKSTDDHNRTLLRAQALAAAEAKASKEEQERLQQMERAREAANTRRHRHRRRHHDSKERKPSRHRDRESRHHKRKERSRDRYHSRDTPKAPSSVRQSGSRSLGDEKHRRHRDPSSSDSPDHDGGSHRKRKRRHRSEERDGGCYSHTTLRHDSPTENRRPGKDEEGKESESDSSEIRWRQRHRKEKSRLLLRDSTSPGPPSPSATSGRRSPSRTPTGTPEPSHSRHRYQKPPSDTPGRSLSKSKFKPIDRPKSPTPPLASGSGSSRSLASRPRSPSPAPVYSSKMDRYFSEGYDPRLDTVSLNKKPMVPKEGLIPAEDFEGWDTMLELIKVRRQDKAEKRRLEMLYGNDDTKKRKKKKGEKSIELAWETVAKKRQALSEKEPGVMDIRYQSKGSVREWDMGKVDVDLL